MTTAVSPACRRCGRIQPLLPRGVTTCVFCSAPLAVVRWRAVTPAGAGSAPMPTPVPRRHSGPPSYRGAIPRWGLPPVAWRPAAITGRDDQVDETDGAGPGRLLTASTMLVAATAVACALAAGAEWWRYLLLLRGRTEVLSGVAVSASDALVRATSWLAVGLALAAVLVLVPTLVRTAAAAAARLGHRPARSGAAVVGRLVIPGWNVYGAGQVLGEIDALLRLDPEAVRADATLPRLRLSTLAVLWWWCWVGNAALVVVALLRAFGSSDQARADTVELHLFIDAVGALVALLTLLLLWRFRRALRPVDPLAGWTVAAPAATSDRRLPSGQPVLSNTPVVGPTGPDATSATNPASSAGDQPVSEPGREPTTATPIP